MDYPCALVHWYKTSDEPDATTGLWVVRPEFIRRGVHHMSVIHTNTIIRVAHLLLRFPLDAPVHPEVDYMNVLDVFTSFYVNKFINHHVFEIAF